MKWQWNLSATTRGEIQKKDEREVAIMVALADRSKEVEGAADKNDSKKGCILYIRLFYAP